MRWTRRVWLVLWTLVVSAASGLLGLWSGLQLPTTRHWLSSAVDAVAATATDAPFLHSDLALSAASNHTQALQAALTCASLSPLLHPPVHLDAPSHSSSSALFTSLVRRFVDPSRSLPRLLREWNATRCLPPPAVSLPLCSPRVLHSQVAAACEPSQPQLPAVWRLQASGVEADAKADSVRGPGRTVWSDDASIDDSIAAAMPDQRAVPWELVLTPAQCRLLPVRPAALRSCLSGRSVLWVGDSTTRYHFLTTVWLLERQALPFPYDVAVYLDLLKGERRRGDNGGGADFTSLPAVFLRSAAQRWNLSREQVRIALSPDGQACSKDRDGLDRGACRERQLLLLEALFERRLRVQDRNRYQYYHPASDTYLAFVMNWGLVVDVRHNLRYGLANYTRLFEEHTRIARSRSGQAGRRVFDVVVENSGLWDLTYTTALHESCDERGERCDFDWLYAQVEPFYRDFHTHFPHSRLVRRQCMWSPPSTGHAPSELQLVKSRILAQYEERVFTNLTLRYGHSLLPTRAAAEALSGELAIKLSYDGTHLYAFAYEAVNALLFATVCHTTQRAADLTPLAAALHSAQLLGTNGTCSLDQSGTAEV